FNPKYRLVFRSRTKNSSSTASITRSARGSKTSVSKILSIRLNPITFRFSIIYHRNSQLEPLNRAQLLTQFPARYQRTRPAILHTLRLSPPRPLPPNPPIFTFPQSIFVNLHPHRYIRTESHTHRREEFTMNHIIGLAHSSFCQRSPAHDRQKK